MKILLLILFITISLFGNTFSDIELLINSNKVREALLKLDNLPTDRWEFNFLIGKLKFYQHEYDDAEEYLEKAYELNKNDLDCNIYLTTCINEGSNSFFGLTSRLKNHIEAIDKAYSVNPKKYARFYIEILPLLSVMPSMIGGNKVKAKIILDNLKKNNNLYELEISKAFISIFEYKLNESNQEKINIINRFEEIENKYPNRASTKIYSNTFFKVIEDYESGIKIAKNLKHPLDYYYYGYYQTKIKSDIDKGILCLEKYLQFDIDISKDYQQYANAHKLLAILYNDTKNKKKAIYHIDKAIELDPGRIDKYEDIKDIIED